MRRIIVGVSQAQIGEALGITFQQVQHYEKGINRIGASRLQQIAKMLGVRVEFFFEGMPQLSRHGALAAMLHRFMWLTSCRLRKACS
jgi:transcriptional regulator with XRE-family HTH domain